MMEVVESEMGRVGVVVGSGLGRVGVAPSPSLSLFISPSRSLSLFGAVLLHLGVSSELRGQRVHRAQSPTAGLLRRVESTV